MATNNWSLPDNTSQYAVVLSNLKDLIYKAATMMEDTASDSNIPANAIRWSVANNRFEIFDGVSSWAELTTDYAISANKLDGELPAYYTDVANMTGGNIPSGHIDNTSHGALSGGTLHSDATTSVSGFISATDKVKLNGLSILSDADIETAYNNQVALVTDGDFTTTSVRRFSPDKVAKTIEAKLSDGVTAVVFTSLYDNGSRSGSYTLNVKSGQYQKLTASGTLSLGFTSPSAQPYTMYIYITTNNFTVSVPTGKWEGGTVLDIDVGLALLTVNWDGGAYYYMLSAEMA